MIVANRVGVEGSGFESDTNEVLLVMRGGEVIEVPRAPKREIADAILGQTIRSAATRWQWVPAVST